MKDCLDQVKLSGLMALTGGSPAVVVGLIDGPVALDHPELSEVHVRQMPGKGGACVQRGSTACMHGTFIAGILFARRDSYAPAICPDCTLMICPIFGEKATGNGTLPSAQPQELARAIMACIEAGVRVLNVSAAIAQPSSKDERVLEDVLEHAARRGVIVVAAAGNQGTLGSTAITRHPWVIPVIACDARGRPTALSNLGSSIGRRGLSAPGDHITSLGANREPLTLGGTSAAVPFVSGAIALLWSLFPDASAAAVKLAVTRAPGRRNTIVPPPLDAWTAYQVLAKIPSRAAGAR